jgi:tetratricopeptide (TPR) repeat protein
MIPQEWLKFAPKPKVLSKDKEWNIFLSYRSVNRAWVLSLYDVLSELGHKVFLDQYVLKAGDKLRVNLDRGLTKSQAGILIWSSAVKDSSWVRDEYDTLQNMADNDPNFQFVPVAIDKTKIEGILANRIFVDFSGYPDGPNGGELLRLLHAVAGIPLSNEAVHFANEQNDMSANAIAKVQAAIKLGNAQRLIQLYNEGGLPWQTSAALGCKTAEGLIRLKANSDAITMLEDVEIKFPRSIRPKQLKALAYARRGQDGDVEAAQEILGVLYELNNLDPETMGIYARTWMDRYDKSKDISDLKQSRDLYADAFEKSPDDYYTGINAAAKSVFLGTEKDIAKASDYAARVQQLTGSEVVKGDYWKTATVAEVLLIQKKYAEAAAIYEAAVGIARKEGGTIESTLKQATRLIEKLQPSDEEKKPILNAFS